MDLWFGLIFLVFCIQHGSSMYHEEPEPEPEFLSPIKNITAPIGSNVDFSCLIRNLGNSRIMWYRRPPGIVNGRKDEFLGVNNLKVTKSAKISLSVKPRSGDVTESILYIYNVDPDDNGIYTCGVDTDPRFVGISMSGSLEAVLKEEMSTTTVTTELPLLPPNDIQRTETAEEEGPKSGLFCIDIKKLWSQAKNQTHKFFTLIWTEINALFR